MQSTTLRQQGQIDEGPDDGVALSSGVCDGRLDRRQFDMAATAIERFEDYLCHATQGTDVDRTRKGQLREDEYDPDGRHKRPSTTRHHRTNSRYHASSNKAQSVARARNPLVPTLTLNINHPIAPHGTSKQHQSVAWNNSSINNYSAPLPENPTPGLQLPAWRRPARSTATPSHHEVTTQTDSLLGSATILYEPVCEQGLEEENHYADQDPNEGFQRHGVAGKADEEGDGEYDQRYFDETGRWVEEGVEARY
ncbi:hypothetical protein BDW67DRAFT_189500 [Aspergillus spinulosporus]